MASKTDIYEVRQLGIVSNFDYDVLIDLYQPLINTSSVSLYLTLINDPSKENNKISTFDELSIRTGLSLGEMYNCFEALEATGLIKTYYKEDKIVNGFIFMVYSPLSANEFFNDILLFSTLKNQLNNQKEIDRLLKKYSRPNENTDYSNVSTSFSDYFSTKIDKAYSVAHKQYSAISHKTSSYKAGFDFILMAKSLSELGIYQKDFSPKEIEYIEKLATLYLMDESQMSTLLSLSFDNTQLIGNKVNLTRLEKDCRTTFGSSFRKDSITPAIKSDIDDLEGDNAKLIKLMDSLTPAEYLSFKQNNTKPASSDLKIVESLLFELSLPYPVINALLDYVLKVNNNMLSKPYIEKIGAALSREGVKTALDTMDYLFRVNNSFKTNSKKRNDLKKDNLKDSIINESEEYSDEEVEALLKSFSK